jgi:hypothetical protein
MKSKQPPALKSGKDSDNCECRPLNKKDLRKDYVQAKVSFEKEIISKKPKNFTHFFLNIFAYC